VNLPLPPLPRVGGETTGRSVIDVVEEQHRGLLALCDRLDDPAGDRARVASVLVAVLSRHLSGEEQYLYPAVRAVVPDGELLAGRELAEDRRLLELLRELDRHRPDRPEFGSAATRLTTAIRRHVAADDEELLPVLREMAPVEDLIRVGNRLETAMEAAPTRPHPRTPLTPPWNKLVDPVVAVADKIRDGATRRATYPTDLDT
jgi:hemerythrin-like domain-containing protein